MQLLTRGLMMRFRTLSFFGVNSHSFDTKKRERSNSPPGTPHGLTKNTLNFLIDSCWSLGVEMPDIVRIWRVLKYGTF